MPAPLFRYRLFGRVVETNFPLGELPRARRGKPDVRFRVVDRVKARVRWVHAFAGTTYGRTKEGFVLRFTGRADFFLRPDGKEIVCAPLPGERPGDVAALFLSQALPLSLTLVGATILHGSGIEMGGGVVAFVGDSGRGKSTLACALVRRGRNLVSDDALCLSRSKEGFRVTPGVPELRLRGRVDRLFFPEVGTHSPAFNKRRRRAHRFAGRRTLPLRAICLLSPVRSGKPVATHPVGGSRALHELLGQTFRVELADPSHLARELSRLAELVDNVPILRLDVPRSLGTIDRVVAAIEERFESGSLFS